MTPHHVSRRDPLHVSCVYDGAFKTRHRVYSKCVELAENKNKHTGATVGIFTNMSTSCQKLALNDKLMCFLVFLNSNIFIEIVAAFRKQKSSRQTTEKMKTRLQTPTNMLAARNESLVRLAKSMKSPRQLYSPPTCSRSQYSYRPKNPTPGEVSVSPSHWGWMKATAFKIDLRDSQGR